MTEIAGKVKSSLEYAVFVAGIVGVLGTAIYNGGNSNPPNMVAPYTLNYNARMPQSPAPTDKNMNFAELADKVSEAYQSLMASR